MMSGLINMTSAMYNKDEGSLGINRKSISRENGSGALNNNKLNKIG